jgi:hypothetical protein
MIKVSKDLGCITPLSIIFYNDIMRGAAQKKAVAIPETCPGFY